MNEYQKQLDSRALEMSTQALTLIQAHIQSCDTRYEQLVERFDESSIDRKEMRQTLNRWMTAVMALLVVSLGYYLVRFGLPGVPIH